MTQAAEYPRAIFVLAPLAASLRWPKYFAPRPALGPFTGGGGLALFDGCAKKFGFRTFWHNLALRLPVRAAGPKAISTTTEEQKINDTRLGAAGYAFTRSPDAADLSMAAMTSWRWTASAKSGTV